MKFLWKDRVSGFYGYNRQEDIVFYPIGRVMMEGLDYPLFSYLGYVLQDS